MTARSSWSSDVRPRTPDAAGLGTRSPGDLARRLGRFGDSVLLRRAMDASDWRTDRIAPDG